MVISSTLQQLLDKYGKHCPKCRSNQVSSGNNSPLWHRCIDCGHRFPDAEAIVGKPKATDEAVVSGGTA